MIKKRILFVDHIPFVGGAQLALVRHLKYLDRKRFYPLVACSSDSPELVERFKEAGAEVFTIPFGKLKLLNPLIFLRFFQTFGALYSLIKSRKVDLVVTNTERAAYPATLATFLRGTKIIWIVRDFEYLKPLFRRLLKFVSVVVFVSQAVKKFYFGQKKDPRLKVVYVGSDFNDLLKAVTQKEVEARRERWGVGRGRIAIGFVGRLVSWKGAQVLLEAGKIMKESGFDVGHWRIIIVGSGGEQKGANEENLHQKVVDWHLGNDVIFMGYRRDVSLCLKAFDIFVHPSVKGEPFATVIVEAMMAGLPVVASNLGGTPEIVRGGETGLLFPAGNAQALVNVLIRLMRDFSLRKTLGGSAREKANKDFSEEKTTQKFERIYERILLNETC